MNQTKKVKTKKKRSSVQKYPQLLVFIKIVRLSTNSKVKTKKKRLRPKICSNFHEIRCESTKITKKQFLLTNSRAISTILRVLDLSLHSSSPEPVNFFGAQSSLGGTQLSFGGTSSHLGGRPRNAPRGAGPENGYSQWKFFINF